MQKFAELQYERPDFDLLEEQVKEYMTLCLHIIQHFTYPFREEKTTN